MQNLAVNGAFLAETGCFVFKMAVAGKITQGLLVSFVRKEFCIGCHYNISTGSIFLFVVAYRA